MHRLIVVKDKILKPFSQQASGAECIKSTNVSRVSESSRLIDDLSDNLLKI